MDVYLYSLSSLTVDGMSSTVHALVALSLYKVPSLPTELAAE